MPAPTSSFTPTAAGAAGPAAPAFFAARPLTHPRAPRRSDIPSAQEAAPQPPAPVPAVNPPQEQVPAQVHEHAGERVEVTPVELLDAVRRIQGVDVSDVPIHRGPEVADQASSLGARSFTRDAEVFLPMEQGSVDQPAARGLLAHELTHAAQQRTLGGALPAEDSYAGQALEAQAVAAERWARGLGPEPAAFAGTVTHPAAAPPASAPSMSSWTAPWQAPPTAGVQRQADDVTSIAELDYPSASSGTVEYPSVPSARPTEPQTTQAAPAPYEELGAARDRLVELSKQRPLNLDDPGDIEELTVRVYQKIERRLRRELLVGRERAGRLGETGPLGPAR
jgi:uncharacterized protein DUF4157